MWLDLDLSLASVAASEFCDFHGSLISGESELCNLGQIARF